MTNHQQAIEDMGERFSSEIERLDKMALNIFAINNIQYIYNRLNKINIEMTMEFFMEVETLTTSLVVAYGRLFGQTTGTTKLNPKIIPPNLRPIHDELLDYRNSRYAHHGDHDTIDTGIELLFDGKQVTVNPKMEIGFWVSASKNWAPLFPWLNEYIFNSMNKQLEHLTKISGVTWTMNYGEKPTWV